MIILLKTHDNAKQIEKGSAKEKFNKGKFGNQLIQ